MDKEKYTLINKGYVTLHSSILDNPSSLPFLIKSQFQYPYPAWEADMKTKETDDRVTLIITFESQILSNPPFNMQMAKTQTMSTFEIVPRDGINSISLIDKDFEEKIFESIKGSQTHNDKEFESKAKGTELKGLQSKRLDDEGVRKDVKNRFFSQQ